MCLPHYLLVHMFVCVRLFTNLNIGNSIFRGLWVEVSVVAPLMVWFFDVVFVVPFVVFLVCCIDFWLLSTIAIRCVFIWFSWICCCYCRVFFCCCYIFNAFCEPILIWLASKAQTNKKLIVWYAFLTLYAFALSHTHIHIYIHMEIFFTTAMQFIGCLWPFIADMKIRTTYPKRCVCVCVCMNFIFKI